MSGSGDQKLEGPDLAAGVPFAELREGQALLGHIEGEAALLVRAGDDVLAIGATCTHYGGPLAEGLVAVDARAAGGASSCTVRCPWHHACFDARTGAAIGGPALNALPTWEVRREGELVRLGAKKPEARGTVTTAGAPSSVVIVGAGPAGAVCAETLRREGYDGPIALVGAELPGPVDRPNLSKDYLVGNAPEEWMPLRGEDFYREMKIDFRIGETVTAIDRAARTVTTDRGPYHDKALGYGALLLATGAEPVRLTIEGATLPHVHLLRTLADSRAIIAGLPNAKRAVVIGASFIGLEAAASLRQRGLDVTVVGPDSVPLARVLGEKIGRFVQSVHEEKGERFELGRKPAKITERAVVLDDGRELPADVVVMGVGVRARTKLAEAAGLRVENGIVVGEGFRTADPNVWAAGDVARFPYDGALVRIEHFAVAERQGRAAALAMLGRPHAGAGVPFFWSQHHDVTLSYVGHAERWDSIEMRGSLDARDALIAYVDGGRVRAVVTVGRDRTSLLAERAMETGDEAALRALLD